MEDADVFIDDVNYEKPIYINILNKYVQDVPSTPNGPKYQCGRKLLAEECLEASNEAECAFNLSESVSASIRTMAVYRDEQIRAAENKKYYLTSYIKPVQEAFEAFSLSKEHSEILNLIKSKAPNVTETLNRFQIKGRELPFYRQYLKFSSHNNVNNFLRILNELPKEWTIVQLTAPYNPNAVTQPLAEYRRDINGINISLFTNDYLDQCGLGPVTVNVPANTTKDGEKPLFTELYSLLDANYETINNAQVLNNKRLVQNYWSRREDVDLRMKSVINVMDKGWLGGFGSLLTGKLVDSTWRDKIIELVNTTISDWGFLKLSPKQKLLLYNLVECCQSISSVQAKSCIRRILTEHLDVELVRKNLECCENCTKEFRFLTELCHNCLAKCFEKIHFFKLMDGVSAFWQAMRNVRELGHWAELKRAKRNPVILIVDEMLDTFPWESLPLLNNHPVSRMENIHFLYYLYKIHEKDIKDGYFCTKSDVGRYVINPEKNLDRMESRMSSFVRYWCPEWSGHVGQPPAPAEFLDHLVKSNIFLYCGHGDGCSFANGGANGAGVEGAIGTKSVAILSGCGSVRLVYRLGREPPLAAHHHLHIAGCPTVVGMLWEVTDLEVDKVVSTLVSLCVPSEAAVPWHKVGKAKWSQGVLEVPKEEHKAQSVAETNFLRAICRARSSTNYTMIASSMVARGLPVRIRSN